jgi:hypothetical protein
MSLQAVWKGMRGRCLDPRHRAFKYYGERGIKIEFANFRTFEEWALANGYKPGLWIDRKDNDGNYSPENCTWITESEKGV